MKHVVLIIVSCIYFISYNAYSEDISSFLILSKQKTLLNNAEVIANNIANAETTGFKENKLIEREYNIKFNNNKDSGYANDISTVKNMENGSLIRTGNSLDFSILGDGFFLIQTDNGERYTRAGNFILNPQGSLVTIDGNKVLGSDHNEITIPNNASEITINEDGRLIINGAAIGTVGVGSFDNNNMLEQEGGSLYRHKENASSSPADNSKFKIVQGYLEASNVNKVRQLTNLIEIQRDVTYVSTMLNMYDDLDRNVIAKLGRN